MSASDLLPSAWSGEGIGGADPSTTLSGDEVAHQLLVDVAHDLRSPLASVLFLVEQVRRGASGPLTPLMERQLGLVYSAAAGMSAVVSDLMEVGRGGAHLVHGPPVPFSVSELLRGVRDLVQPLAVEKGLALRVTCAVDADLRMGHPAALRRVLLNLATNAVKFTARGSVDLLAEAKERDVLHFTVRDSGRGLPSRVLEALGDEASAPTAAFSSAGLGLAICRRLVTHMRGELEVTSEPNRGTVARIAVALALA
ncbi:MAG: HAMP domain-containing histidine kinase [Gemmatimonadaceae bacterium]|jgi:signal transduction histidine kinase|nr:HAMP domain-containing histidine kinase [Gemmatimonadaceae bacterium]